MPPHSNHPLRSPLYPHLPYPDPYAHYYYRNSPFIRRFVSLCSTFILLKNKNVSQGKYARYSAYLPHLFDDRHIRQPPLHKLLESIQRKQQYIHLLKIPDSTAIGDLCFFVVILSGKVLSLPFTSTYRSSMSNSSCPFSSLSKEPLYAFR